jgi:hypothetical protein
VSIELLKRLVYLEYNYGNQDTYSAAKTALVLEEAKNGGWVRAVDEELVGTHLGVASASDSYEVAKKKLTDIINWNIRINKDLSKPDLE